jgi:hypothetical protein
LITAPRLERASRADDNPTMPVDRTWRTPTAYARAAGVPRRYVWRLVEKGALEVRRIKTQPPRKRAAGVRVRDR